MTFDIGDKAWLRFASSGAPAGAEVKIEEVGLPFDTYIVSTESLVFLVHETQLAPIPGQ